MPKQLKLEMQTVYLGPARSDNPMVRIHGPGPEGTTCGQCGYIFGRVLARVYWKCGKRGDLTHGAKTDQKKRWMSCGLFERPE